MDIINGGRALMNIRHKLNILIKNKRNLDFNIDDAEISYLSKGRTNDSYLLDFYNFKLVLRLNSKNDFDLGINRENEALILKTLDNQSFMPNLIYIDEFYKFIIYEYIEGVNLDLKKTSTHQKKEILKLIDTLQEIKIDLPKFNYFSHLSGYWEKIKTNKDFFKKIKENRHLDLVKKYTSFGPHKDDVVFLWNNQKIKNHGSQGEHKIFLALLKINEYIFLSNETKKTPIFLIDDMFANLDKERSKKLLRFIEKIKNDNKEKSQTIITTTNIINIKENGFFMEFDNIKKHHLVKNGTA